MSEPTYPHSPIGFPEPSEAAPYYFRYIDQAKTEDVVGLLGSQLEEALDLLENISEESSLHRYAPDKWSLREVMGHVTDAERLFQFRAFWFARGFDSPLPGFDEKVSAATARPNERSWASHLEELRSVRLATLTLFRNLPAEAWARSGIASDMPFSVRALAYITAGHATHHLTILRERYL